MKPARDGILLILLMFALISAKSVNRVQGGKQHTINSEGTVDLSFFPSDDPEDLDEIFITYPAGRKNLEVQINFENKEISETAILYTFFTHVSLKQAEYKLNGENATFEAGEFGEITFNNSLTPSQTDELWLKITDPCGSDCQEWSVVYFGFSGKSSASITVSVKILELGNKMLNLQLVWISVLIVPYYLLYRKNKLKRRIG